ncbi:TetR/AcrR family transcriptional regulator [Pelagibacterium halotolerans]|uniref:Transcriptional regulator, TetR family n=1 Tax=Pelagibacterium halotolerans (strain DSM 22347 / JCM 15775 / CGMCC 1.7692 / B2) TaxID=1082931 RepID=G4RFX1_PELHB|nr:TetR/AcrR family transcriptional regulator [Pelagibacterium halotolerans]AEQ51014.1 transcriptional regulator, TetR family [Pelagibacterium halotolerans B2]QJR19095.1 TetR/AcrR family transcriptional regulator [Pelagibacterium halotolerans]SEA02539.1 transcriptional regulator, TetR family [Pelagibacterium halotolerans]
MRKGEATRERILEVAEASVLAKGFGATSIEEVIAEAGITKSGFFYHFKDKNELAHQLLRRYLTEDQRILDEVFGRGAELSDDPLQAFLIGLKLLAELMSDLPGGHPGCMIASICYQERLFDRGVVALNREAIESVNARIFGHLEAIAATCPPREPMDIAVMAEMLSCVIDGGIIMAKVTNDPERLVQQILAYRAFIKLQFSASADAAASGNRTIEAA